MKKNKMQIKTVLVMITTVFFILILFGWKNHSRNIYINNNTIDYVIKCINEDLSEIDYSHFIDVEKKDSQILFNNTTKSKSEDNDNCNLMYDITLRNKSNKKIKMYARFYLPKELSSKLIYGSTSFGMNNPKKDYVELNPGQGIKFDMGVLMKHFKLFTEEEKNIFSKNKDILFLELIIDNKVAYVKIT